MGDSAPPQRGHRLHRSFRSFREARIFSHRANAIKDTARVAKNPGSPTGSQTGARQGANCPPLSSVYVTAAHLANDQGGLRSKSLAATS